MQFKQQAKSGRRCGLLSAFNMMPLYICRWILAINWFPFPTWMCKSGCVSTPSWPSKALQMSTSGHSPELPWGSHLGTQKFLPFPPASWMRPVICVPSSIAPSEHSATLLQESPVELCYHQKGRLANWTSQNGHHGQLRDLLGETEVSAWQV